MTQCGFFHCVAIKFCTAFTVKHFIITAWYFTLWHYYIFFFCMCLCSVVIFGWNNVVFQNYCFTLVINITCYTTVYTWIVLHITCFFTCCIFSINDLFAYFMSCCRNNCLCHSYCATVYTFFTFCKTCCFTIRSNCRNCFQIQMACCWNCLCFGRNNFFTYCTSYNQIIATGCCTCWFYSVFLCCCAFCMAS